MKGAALPANTVTTAAITDGAVTSDKIDLPTLPPLTKTGMVNVSTAGNVSVTGVGFKPSRVEFVCDETTSPTSAYSNRGFTDGTIQRVIATAVGTSAAITYQSTVRCIGKIAGTSNRSIASIVSLDADGFTINVSDPMSVTVVYTAYR